jgi:hypothetical protein
MEDLSVHQSSTGIESLADPFLAFVTQQELTGNTLIGMIHPRILFTIPILKTESTIKTFGGIYLPRVIEHSLGQAW